MDKNKVYRLIGSALTEALNSQGFRTGEVRVSKNGVVIENAICSGNKGCVGVENMPVLDNLRRLGALKKNCEGCVLNIYG